PVFATHLADDYTKETDALLGLGAGSVAWIVPPIPNVWWANQTTGQADPARHAVLRSVIDGIAASHPGKVGVVDLRKYLEDNGLATDHDVRPDGVHLDPAAAQQIADVFLGERLIRVALGMP